MPDKRARRRLPDPISTSAEYERLLIEQALAHQANEKAAAIERERCLRIAEQFPNNHTARLIAKQIREGKHVS